MPCVAFFLTLDQNRLTRTEWEFVENQVCKYSIYGVSSWGENRDHSMTTIRTEVSFLISKNWNNVSFIWKKMEKERKLITHGNFVALFRKRGVWVHVCGIDMCGIPSQECIPFLFTSFHFFFLFAYWVTIETFHFQTNQLIVMGYRFALVSSGLYWSDHRLFQNE